MTSSPNAAAKAISGKQPRRQHRQKGFTLLELGIVTAIVAILAAISIPLINGYILSGKVTPLARDLQQAVGSIRSLAAGVASATPYTGVDTATLAAFLRESNFSVNGDTVTHSIQAPGLVPQAVTIDGTSGATFTIKVASVHEKVCPDLASLLSKASESITVGSTNVKTATTSLSLANARSACVAAGADIAFVFR